MLRKKDIIEAVEFLEKQPKTAKNGDKRHYSFEWWAEIQRMLEEQIAKERSDKG